MDKQEQQFRELVRHCKPQRAPVGFSQRVMAQIHALPKIEYKPVFGKWFLTVFLGILAAFVSGVLLLDGSAQPASEAPGLLDKLPQADLAAFNEANKEVVGWFAQIPPVLFFAVMGIAVLLLLDRWLSRRIAERDTTL